MAETASTRTIDRDRLRSRLVSPRSAGKQATTGVSPSGNAPQSMNEQAKPAQFEQSPILFRLPAIVPAAPDNLVAADNLVEPDGFAELEEIASAPEPLHSGRSEPNEIRSDEEATLDIARVESQPHFQSSDSQSRSPIAASEFSSDDAAVNQLQLVSLAETPQIEPAQVAAAAPATEASSEPKRTWWEHWSSGVVLILLVIALVVASIIALNDGGKVRSDQMAGQLEASMLDEFDLSSIAIPDISMPPLSAGVDRPLNSVAQSSPNPTDSASSPVATQSAAATELATSDSTIVDSAAIDLSVVNEAVTESTVAETTIAEAKAGEKLAADKAVGEVILADLAAGGGGIALNATGQTLPEPAAQAIPESIPPLPLATLDRPTEVALPQLFAPQAQPVDASSSSDIHRISGLPASNPTVSLELPRPEVMRAEGSSPTFYDGASIAGGQYTNSGGTVSGAGGPVDTNMPSISAVLASATVSVGPGNAPAAQVVTSATPDLNGESIVEAYLRFQQLHQATDGSVSNRYPDPPAPH